MRGPGHMSLPEGEDANGDRWIEHLSSLYNTEFTLLAATIGIGAFGAPITLGFLYDLPDTCKTAGDTDCVQNGQLILLPMIPLIMIMAFGYVFFSSRVVGKYTRELERAISRTVDPSENAFAVPALSRLTSALYGGESNRLLPLRIFYIVLAGSIVGVSVVAECLVISRISNSHLKNATYVFYASLMLFCLFVYNTGASHSLFAQLKNSAARRDQHLTPGLTTGHRPWRDFLVFLVAPRPLSIFKESHAVVLASMSGIIGVIDPAWVRLSVGMLAFEVILYQTRYLLNGVREDPQAGPQLPANRRNDSLMVHTPLQLLTAWIIAGVRVWFFYWVTVTWLKLFDNMQAGIITCLFIACFYAYEAPREIARIRYRRVMESKEYPQDGSHLPQDEIRALCGSGIGLGRLMFVTVGSGYALRALVAMSLISTTSLGWREIVLVVIAWAMGSAMVGAGWAREFMGAQSVERPSVLHPGITAKPHVLWAGRQLQGLHIHSINFQLLTPSETKEDSTEILGIYPGCRRSSWRWACAVSLILTGLVAPRDTPPSILILLIMFAACWIILLGTQPFGRAVNIIRPPWAPGIVAGGCLTLASTSIASWKWTLGVGTIAIWTLWQVRSAEVGTLASWISQAKKFSSRARQLGSVLGRILVRLVRLILGDVFVRSTSRLFGRS